VAPRSRAARPHARANLRARAASCLPLTEERSDRHASTPRYPGASCLPTPSWRRHPCSRECPHSRRTVARLATEVAGDARCDEHLVALVALASSMAQTLGPLLASDESPVTETARRMI
jgi:hypothetical protein